MPSTDNVRTLNASRDRKEWDRLGLDAIVHAHQWEYVNQRPDGFEVLAGEAWCADDDTMTVFGTSFGNYHSPGCDERTNAEIYGTRAEYDARVAHLAAMPEYDPKYETDDADDDDDDTDDDTDDDDVAQQWDTDDTAGGFRTCTMSVDLPNDLFGDDDDDDTAQRYLSHAIDVARDIAPDYAMTANWSAVSGGPAGEGTAGDGARYVVTRQSRS